MKPLRDFRVLALDAAADGALARRLGTFGAEVRAITSDSLAAELPNAHFLIEGLGPHALQRAGHTRGQIERANPRLIHISVTAFGGKGPRADWRGGELVASAMGGTLRVT